MHVLIYPPPRGQVVLSLSFTCHNFFPTFKYKNTETKGGAITYTPPTGYIDNPQPNFTNFSNTHKIKSLGFQYSVNTQPTRNRKCTLGTTLDRAYIINMITKSIGLVNTLRHLLKIPFSKNYHRYDNAFLSERLNVLPFAKLSQL